MSTNMIQKLTESGVWGRIGNRRGIKAVLVVLLCLSLLTVGIAGQTTGEFSDDFQDGSTDGWIGYNQYPEIRSESVEGSNSLYAQSRTSGSGTTTIEWDSGPRLDTEQEFTLNATFKHNYIDSTSNEIRIGVASDDPSVEGENAFILFDKQENVTYLGTNTLADIPSNTSNTIQNSFENTWVNVKIDSDGNGTLRAKVWEYGTDEPTDYQLERQFEGASGKFGFNVGSDLIREAWLDSVTIQGTTDPLADEITLDTRSLVLPGNSHPYTVIDDTGEIVTNNSSIVSNNSSVLSVNETENRITATNDSNISTVVRLTATESGLEGDKLVVVAEPTVENLQILPTFITRIWAILQDPTIFALLIAALLSVPAGRFAGAFSGLGVVQMVIVVAWLAGYIGIGIAMLSVFTAIFIGLNLAENVQVNTGIQ